MRFQIFQSPQDNKHYFYLKANNGWAYMTSKPHKSRLQVPNTIEDIRLSADDDDQFERKLTKGGRHYFQIVDGNQNTLATSRSYKWRSSMERTITKVKREIKVAKVVEKQPIIKRGRTTMKKRDEV